MASSALGSGNFTVVTFNMHGFNQGNDGVHELICLYEPDCILLQEHWLTPAALDKLDLFTDYFAIGTSAMCDAVESGPLFGRPYGGVAILVHNKFAASCSVICTADRIIALLVNDLVVVNVYLPCKGTLDRLPLFEEVICSLRDILDDYRDNIALLGGDFNVDFTCASLDDCGSYVADFLDAYKLRATYDLYAGRCFVSYYSQSCDSHSLLDYIFTSAQGVVCEVDVLDLAHNFSDHCPVLSCFRVPLTVVGEVVDNDDINVSSFSSLRWDHANLSLYYEATRLQLEPIYSRLLVLNDLVSQVSCDDIYTCVDSAIDEIVDTLWTCSRSCIPSVRKNLLKFWWNEGLSELKNASVVSNNLWKSAGKPRSGDIYLRRQQARLNYRRKLREAKRLEKSSYSDDLHDSLVNRDNVKFWQAWRSHFGKQDRKFIIDNSCDPKVTADNFATFFRDISNPVVKSRDVELECEYVAHRALCSADWFLSKYVDAELLGDTINGLTRGKSPGPDGISSEHVIYAHPVLTGILVILFNFILICGRVPSSFCSTYTVPIPKGSDTLNRLRSTKDFRGISISNIFSKLFESCLLNIFGNWLSTEDNQFGFKKGLGCSHAVFLANSFSANMIDGGDTVNILALDVAKAFPTVNRHALLLKLLKKRCPVAFVDLIGDWLSRCDSFVKWAGCSSFRYGFRTGVNQGSVLAPALFALLINDLIVLCNNSDLGIVLVYADDILLIARTRRNLQEMFVLVQRELAWLNLCLNVDKCCCMRVGPRHNASFTPIVCLDGRHISLVKEIRYLGIFMVSGNVMRSSLHYAKRCFFRASNAIFSQVLHVASDSVVMHLLKVKCLPILLFGLEACPLSRAQFNSLDFVVVRCAMKVFRTISRPVVLDCLDFFGLLLPSLALSYRSAKLRARLASSDNSFVVANLRL